MIGIQYCEHGLVMAPDVDCYYCSNGPDYCYDCHREICRCDDDSLNRDSLETLGL